ncbi:MAG: DUF1684 domain-containing protein [Actinomycetota bacterium]
MTSPHDEEILRWREHRVARLTGSDGWLSVVGLAWLEEGENTVGSDPASKVPLPSGNVPGRIGVIRVEGGAATASFLPGSEVTHAGHPVGTLRLNDDSAGEPTLLRLGSLSFHVIRRRDELAVRIRDEESPARKAFTGIDYYPIDPRWRVEARFEPYDPPRSVVVPTVLGSEEIYAMPGAMVFSHEGLSQRLEVFLEDGETDLFIVFGDLTNGSETYGGGRFLYARPPREDGIMVCDFNKAYNPPCVFTPFATCAVPLPQNKLPIRVEAGEKLYRGPTVASFV